MGTKQFALPNDIYASSVKPILKWAGGKQQLWKEISKYIPENFNKYIEPFFGGGATFFNLMPDKAIISDSNPELINLYSIIQNDVDDLINLLRDYNNEKDFYYKIRALNPNDLSNIERATRILYLNRTCFNGLYRVNKKGEFNVPYGHYTNPKICDENTLRAVSSALQKKIILCEDYLKVLRSHAQSGDLIFLDPPYLPVSVYSDFKRYTKEFFYENDHVKLADEFHRLYNLGCSIILTNSNHPLVFDLYKDYKIEIISTKRNINSNGSKRKGEDAIVIANRNI